MSLSINIADPQAVYRPGDHVVGTVTYTPDNKSIQAQQVIVALKHRSKCRFGLPELETLYSADMILNEQTTELLESPITLQATQEWPFKFIVPDTSSYRVTPFREPSRLYNDDSSQILPPSFHISKKDSAGVEDAAKITLGIYAQIISERIKSNIFKKDGIQAVSLLNFVPQRLHVTVDWDMTTKQTNFEARTPLLAETNGNRQRPLSIKEKMLTSLKSSSLPAASFDVLMSMPKFAVVGQPIPLFVGLQHDQAKNRAQDSPAVVLKTISVKLDSLTGVRGLSESKSHFRSEHLPASHASWTKSVQLAKLGNSIELTDIIDLREQLDLRIPTDTIQTFSTFNIARTYSLVVSVSVECAKQKFSTSFDHPLTLLAGHDYDLESPPGVNSSTAAYKIRGDVLPTWEESGGYGAHGIPVEKKDEEDDGLPPQYA